jgi:hypothetical protein
VGAMPKGAIGLRIAGVGITNVDSIDGNGTSLICMLILKSPKSIVGDMLERPIIGIREWLPIIELESNVSTYIFVFNCGSP